MRAHSGFRILGLQMGEDWDRTADLPVRGRWLYPLCHSRQIFKTQILKYVMDFIVDHETIISIHPKMSNVGNMWMKLELNFSKESEMIFQLNLLLLVNWPALVFLPEPVGSSQVVGLPDLLLWSGAGRRWLHPCALLHHHPVQMEVLVGETRASISPDDASDLPRSGRFRDQGVIITKPQHGFSLIWMISLRSLGFHPVNNLLDEDTRLTRLFGEPGRNEQIQSFKITVEHLRCSIRE